MGEISLSSLENLLDFPLSPCSWDLGSGKALPIEIGVSIEKLFTIIKIVQLVQKLPW